MRDMTAGKPIGHLWRFALPVLLGNWLQLMYNAVDSVIAGRFIGKEALSAEGIAAPVMNLVILGISGVQSVLAPESIKTKGPFIVGSTVAIAGRSIPGSLPSPKSPRPWRALPPRRRKRMLAAVRASISHPVPWLRPRRTAI